MICPGYLGCGWRPYIVETVEGEEERAWELCPECGWRRLPPKEGGQASAPSSPRSSKAIAFPVATTSHAYLKGGEGPAAERRGAERGARYAAVLRLSGYWRFVSG
jgi:hypothetical protein